MGMSLFTQVTQMTPKILSASSKKYDCSPTVSPTLLHGGRATCATTKTEIPDHKQRWAFFLYGRPVCMNQEKRNAYVLPNTLKKIHAVLTTNHT